MTTIEKLVHESDGSLKSELPWYCIPNTGIEITKREEFRDATGMQPRDNLYIDEQAAKVNISIYKDRQRQGYGQSRIIHIKNPDRRGTVLAFREHLSPK